MVNTYVMLVYHKTKALYKCQLTDQVHQAGNVLARSFSASEANQTSDYNKEMSQATISDKHMTPREKDNSTKTKMHA